MAPRALRRMLLLIVALASFATLRASGAEKNRDPAEAPLLRGEFEKSREKLSPDACQETREAFAPAWV
ncbi:MAG: hypothetical protein WKF84_08105 [Pyrinomonadaceae bacterium]